MARKHTGLVIGTVVAGPVGEKVKFRTGVDTSGKRATRSVREDLKKIKQNSFSSLKEMSRLINANFGKEDLLIGLDYSPAGMAKLEREAATRIPGPSCETEHSDEAEKADRIRAAAEHQLSLCLRRVRRVLEKDGMELQYIAITSDMDGDTGELVRVHHHIVASAGCVEAFIAKWEKLGWGGVSWEHLYPHQIDRTPLADYLLRQVRRIPEANKYTSSRNLERPKMHYRAAASDAFLRAPKGCTALGDSVLTPELQYLKYLLPPEQIAAAEEKKRRRREKAKKGGGAP